MAISCLHIEGLCVLGWWYGDFLRIKFSLFLRVRLRRSSNKESVEFRATLTSVLPALRAAIHQQHYVQHRCELCQVSCVTLDAKYGLTCALCNHREGGVIQFPAVRCSVMFGCQNPPMQSSLYCCQHYTAQPLNAAIQHHPRRILRHRDHAGVRSYKVDGSSAWLSAADVGAQAVQDYERFLAEQKDRRKRRRNAAVQSMPLDALVAEDVQYFDAVEPIMNPQEDDVNPCGLDKAACLPRRKYGGLLVATLPCGRVCAEPCLLFCDFFGYSDILSYFRLVYCFCFFRLRLTRLRMPNRSHKSMPCCPLFFIGAKIACGSQSMTMHVPSRALRATLVGVIARRLQKVWLP